MAAAIVGFASGCSSMRSTLFSYDGCQDCEKMTKHLKGVPTTLNVPTHLQVKVWRTRYGKIFENGLVEFVPELETRKVEITPKEQKEIFTVDFKRPAAGSLEYEVEFKDQYITKIKNQSNDETIAKVTALITTIIESVPPTANFRIIDETESQLIPFKEVIASQVFALSTPNVDMCIQEFLAHYVNNCHTCEPHYHGSASLLPPIVHASSAIGQTSHSNSPSKSVNSNPQENPR